MHKKDVNATIESMKQILLKHANRRSPINLLTDAGKEIYNNNDTLKKSIIEKYYI